MPVVCILAGAVLWGTMGIFVRTLTAYGFNDMQKIFYRGLFSAAIILIYLLIFDRSALKIRLRDIWCFIGTGIISFETFGFFYFYTINHADMSVAAILLYTAPTFVMCMSAIFFKEKFTLKKLAALLLTVVGCALVSGIAGAGLNLTALTLFTGIMSGLCYALYSIFATVALRRYSSMTVTFYTFVFSSIGTLPFINIPTTLTMVFTSGEAFVKMLLFAAVTSFFPYMLYTGGLKYTEAGKASVCASLEPVVAAILGFFVFSEGMRADVFAGIALVVSAIVIMNIKKRGTGQDCKANKNQYIC